MATRTRGGLLVAAAIVVAAGVAVPALRDEAVGLFGGGTELVGEGETQFMVAASAASEVHKCQPAQELADEGCNGLRFVIFDAAKMPFITRNISTAWVAGKPGVLTRNSAAEAGNRRDVCRKSFPRRFNGECDEYPFASTDQGGSGAQEREVPSRENSCQGGTLRAAYRDRPINDGQDFLVVITHPKFVAAGEYSGVDVGAGASCL